MASWKTNNDFLKPENIKSLKDCVKPTVTRDKSGKVTSVGMEQGKRFYRLDKTKSLIDYSDVYDVEQQEVWKRYYYPEEIAKLIDDGLIWIKYEAPVVVKEPEIKEHQNQTSMF